MAEHIFKIKLKETPMHGKVEVGSAGTAAMPYYSIYGELKQVLEENDIDFSDHRPRMVDLRIIEQSCLLLCMTERHIQEINLRFGVENEKVRLLSDYAAGELKDIPDPMGRGVDAYRKVFKIIDEYLEKLKEKLENEFKG